VHMIKPSVVPIFNKLLLQLESGPSIHAVYLERSCHLLRDIVIHWRLWNSQELVGRFDTGSEWGKCFWRKGYKSCNWITMVRTILHDLGH
jgi:hypothetical protein